MAARFCDGTVKAVMKVLTGTQRFFASGAAQLSYAAATLLTNE